MRAALPNRDRRHRFSKIPKSKLPGCFWIKPQPAESARRMGRAQVLASLPFGHEVKLRYSPSWLWWQYINHDGSDVGGCFLIAMGLIPLAGASMILLLMVTIEVPFWLEGKQAQGTITNK